MRRQKKRSDKNLDPSSTARPRRQMDSFIEGSFGAGTHQEFDDVWLCGALVVGLHHIVQQNDIRVTFRTDGNQSIKEARAVCQP